MSYKERSLQSRPSSQPSKPPLSSPSSSSPPSGPVAILWDIENCPVPNDVKADDISSNIRSAIRSHPSISTVTTFSAFGDFNGFPRRLREGCQRTGVKLVDVPNGRKDAADKAILVDMFLFALDNRPPSSIVLISGDVDFAPALHILGQRGYTIVLVLPSSVGVSGALSSAGNYVWDWQSMARGQGLVPFRNGSKSLLVPQAQASVPVPVPVKSVPVPISVRASQGQTSVLVSAEEDNEEETIVYRGSTSREFCSRSYDASEGHFGNFTRRAQSVPLGIEREEPDRDDQDKWWVRPGDFNGLKGQLVRLVELSRGTIPLLKVPPEYHRLYGRHLYISEYGASKLVDLFSKMSDAFVIIGKGNKRTVCLRNTCDANNIKMCASTPVILKRGEKIEEKNVCSSEEEESEEEKTVFEFEESMEGFKLEVQELLVCFGCPVGLGDFEGLYVQKYKKRIEYCKFGVNGLEELVEKIPEVVRLVVERESKNKFLIPNFLAG